ncbi:MAG TPA: hypothetical protein VK892_04290 [Pyrinomonadaceae bacterium]|nr:hypothetical protein [Pyrinomonadaceae bacterium]
MEREKQLAEIDKEEAGKEDIPPESDNTQSDNTQEDKSYYNTNSLKARGWTDEMIKDLLGDADTKQCGRMRSKSLYLDSRVEAVEKTKEFTDWKTKNKAKETQSNKTQSGKSKTKKKA